MVGSWVGYNEVGHLVTLIIYPGGRYEYVDTYPGASCTTCCDSYYWTDQGFGCAPPDSSCCLGPCSFKVYSPPTLKADGVMQMVANGIVFAKVGPPPGQDGASGPAPVAVPPTANYMTGGAAAEGRPVARFELQPGLGGDTCDRPAYNAPHGQQQFRADVMAYPPML